MGASGPSIQAANESEDRYQDLKLSLVLTRCVVATEREISVDADQYEHERNDFPQESARSRFGKGLHVDIRGLIVVYVREETILVP